MARVILALGVLCAIVSAGEVELAPQTHQTWRFELPAPAFAPLADGKILGFAAEKKSGGLAIDTDGDGATDVVVRGNTGVVKLRRGDFRYAVRVALRGNWQYTTAGSLAGEIDGLPVRLIDQNNNGRYDDFGVDAMIVGHGKSAAFLSRVIAVGKNLMNVAVDGRTLRLTPYTGPRGTLDVATKFKSDGRLLAAVFRSKDGRHSFELSAAEGAVSVPAGAYTLMHGVVKNGGEIVRIRAGRAKALEIADGAAVAWSWGGPLACEYQAKRGAGSLTFDPQAMRYFGRAGEEYYGFFPSGRPAEFAVRNAATKEVLTVAKFVPC